LTLLLAGLLATAIGGAVLYGFAEDAASGTTTATATPPRGQGFMMGEGRGGKGCGRESPSKIEVSSEYTQKVKDILNSDADAKNLLTKGYNVTVIHPNLKRTVAGDGSVTQVATTAVVLLEKAGTGFARIDIDVAAAKVTRIEIVTRTIIDKSTN
jgi:hypothetical protein